MSTKPHGAPPAPGPAPVSEVVIAATALVGVGEAVPPSRSRASGIFGGVKTVGSGRKPRHPGVERNHPWAAFTATRMPPHPGGTRVP
jgi:hypothetical protein